MLLSTKELANKPKIYFTHGLLPKSVDPKQLPHGQKPFSVILRERWLHTVGLIVCGDRSTNLEKVDLTLPEDSFGLFQSAVQPKLKPAEWSRVKMPLRALVESPFLDQHVKSGSASMLSSGRSGLDPLYKLHEGILRIELPKELYERAGLVGSVIQNGTHPHQKRWFAIEIDLRQPSMQRGKKGFERIKWSFRNVLTEPVTWLLHDHSSGDAMQSLALPGAGQPPVINTVTPVVTHHNGIRIPNMRSWSEGTERDGADAMDMLEYLSMVGMQSDRLSAEDRMDPYLSRWNVPEPEAASVGNVVHVRWHGFIQASWVHELMIACMMATRTQAEAWFAITARSFNSGPGKEVCDGYTILRTRVEEGKTNEDGLLLRPEFLLWEMEASINL